MKLKDPNPNRKPFKTVTLTAEDIRRKRLKVAEDLKNGLIDRRTAEYEIADYDFLEGKEERYKDPDEDCTFCAVEKRIACNEPFDPHLD